jgi:DNA-binding response OmpR family regulator
MTRIVVVADVPWVRNEVHASLTAPDYQLIDLADPSEAAARALDEGADAVIVDLQVGSMGGMAVTRDVRDRSRRTGHGDLPVVMLLDRSADSFLAKRAGAAAWLIKPFSPYEIRNAVDRAVGATTAAVVPSADAE